MHRYRDYQSHFTRLGLGRKKKVQGSVRNSYHVIQIGIVLEL